MRFQSAIRETGGLLLTIVVCLSYTGCEATEPGNDTAEPTTPATTSVLDSAGPLEFGPGGLLFVGDSYGSRLVAIETLDSSPPTDATSGVYIKQLDVELGALLGSSPKDIVINDMVVNPDSQNVYFSVHVGRSIAPGVAIARLNKNTGTLEALDLAALSHTEITLPEASGFEDTLQYGQSIRMLTITDITWYDGELFVAGVSNQDFDSTLRRIAYPFTDTQSITTLEIYHASHGQMETHAPIVTSLVYEINGSPYLIAAYACTPLARFRLAALTDGAHVIGETIAELGYGNSAVDMFLYQNPPQLGGGERLLITNDQRAAVSVSTAAVAAATPLTTPAKGPTGLDQITAPMTGTLHADVLTSSLSVVVRRNVQTGDLSLMSLRNGAFFEVAEMIVEYNFPNVMDSTTTATNPIAYGFEE